MLGLPRYVVHGAGGGGNAPSLNFNFVDGSAFSPQITFTRASSATLFDSSGTLVYAPMNLLTYSEQFDNAAWDKLNLNTTGTPPWVDVEVAPDGTNTADKITEDTATSSHSISQNVTVSASTTYSFSVFLKTAGRNAYIRYDRTGSSGDNIIVTLDLSTGTVVSAVASGIATLSGSSIVSVGNGWYRCTLSGSLGANTDGRVRVFLLDGTTVSYTGDGTSGIYIWGAQLEAGAFPTSYIPTTTTSLTRSADVASVNTLSPWFNATEGTLFVRAAVGSAAATGVRLAALDDGTSSNIIRFAGGAVSFQVLDAGSVEANLGLATLTDNVAANMTGAYKANDFAASINGGAVVTDNSGTLPTVDRLILGSASGTNPKQTWIQRLTYYPRRLSNAELQSITS